MRIPAKGQLLTRQLSAHIISFEQNILVCSCGYKHCYGIPCRHLFAIESEYNLANFSCHWQVAYCYYAFHPDHMELTKTFQERELCNQQGIQMKTVQQAPSSFPFLLQGSVHSADNILQSTTASFLLLYGTTQHRSILRSIIITTAAPRKNAMTIAMNLANGNNKMISQESIDIPIEGLQYSSSITRAAFAVPMSAEVNDAF
jgi:hypothetical protein